MGQDYMSFFVQTRETHPGPRAHLFEAKQGHRNDNPKSYLCGEVEVEAALERLVVSEL